ncbi:substrate-binding domain-containing protein [Agrococcus sp. SGAir0287]|uniref:substrate-binding domain-containing protein n=1 Tax=Agrococcus sp. SGAir0287 TaxID=2070347 RepID=UPI0010CCE8D1|nr:substrate-binding domain-containing protein [Agrococcus sp. SGAir0287]QCR19252.1 hypothetical protein C1N71_07260 [Agrococcus sp. SGAir0287]
MRTRLMGLAALAATALVATGCSTVSNDPATSEGGDGAGPFTIGISNGFVGSEYRTQMIADIEDAASSYQDEGLLEDLVLENADTDVNGQIQQVRNLINAGVDAIIVDPNSGSALDQVFQEATDQGILVFAIDQAVTAESVINVGIDQAEWAETSAQWLADQVGEGGQIVAVNGISGHPANEARWGAAQAVFDDAGVEVLTTADGGWDQATGQQQMGNLLATYPDIDGVWTQDGMALGVLQAVIAADRVDEVVVTGEARNGFLQLWSEQSDDFESIGVTNPPGTGATALHLAMAMLQGAELDDSQLVDGNTLVLALEEPVTNENLDAVYGETESEGESYVLDSILSADDVRQYLVQD